MLINSQPTARFPSPRSNKTFGWRRDEYSLVLEEVRNEIEAEHAGLLVIARPVPALVPSCKDVPSWVPAFVGDRLEVLKELERLCRERRVLHSVWVRGNLDRLNQLLLHGLLA